MACKAVLSSAQFDFDREAKQLGPLADQDRQGEGWDCFQQGCQNIMRDDELCLLETRGFL
jgi:hypothetical protein